MHILILADSIDNQSAGIHTYTKSLICEFLKLKNPSLKLTFIHSHQNPFFEGLNHYIIPRGKYPGGESVRKFIKIPKLIRKLKPNIVWEPCHIGPFNLPKSIKRVVTIHDITPILFPHLHTFRGRFIHKLLLGISLKNADLIITPSQTTANDIKNNYKISTKIETIPLGITPEPQKKSTERSTIPYILFLGTIEPRKNLDLLIDAFNELKKEHSIPHRLVLAGQIGWKSEEIIEKVKASRDIYLKGFVTEEEKAELYRNAAMFVYPSLYEGFGLPPMEALSYDIPVICSNGGSLREFFQGKALMFNPGDKDKLKELILETFKSPHPPRQHKNLKTWNGTAAETLEQLIRLNLAKKA